jgi:hypothetical protein
MTYEERMAAGHEDYVKTLKDDQLLEGTVRAKDWADVVRWVEQWDLESAKGAETEVVKQESKQEVKVKAPEEHGQTAVAVENETTIQL